MELSITGAIKVDGHLARFTDEGQWMVSRHDTVLGYVDSLAEVASLIAEHRERIRARLAFVQRKAAERQAEENAPVMRTLTDVEFLSKVKNILP